jgi:hypothetical protein
MQPINKTKPVKKKDLKIVELDVGPDLLDGVGTRGLRCTEEGLELWGDWAGLEYPQSSFGLCSYRGRIELWCFWLGCLWLWLWLRGGVSSSGGGGGGLEDLSS